MNELPLYQIAEWNDYFENHRSRKLHNCGFVCVPNKHGGHGLTAVLNAGPGIEGLAVYGLWILILEYCSRQRSPRDGYLTSSGKKDGVRLCVAELARMFKSPQQHVRQTLRVLCSVGWVRLIDGTPENPSAAQWEISSHTPADDPENLSPTSRQISSHPPAENLPICGGNDNALDNNELQMGENPALNGRKSGDERKKERMKEPILTFPKGRQVSNFEVNPDLQTALDQVEGDDAKSFHDSAERLLRKFGEVKREVQVPDRGDGRAGYVDLVVTGNGDRIGIELDQNQPREKSVHKLSCNFTKWIVLCRGPGGELRVDDETKKWLNSLFGRQREWSYEELQLLSSLLPIEKDDRALLSWAYALPKDAEGWALVDGVRANKPKSNLIGLLREFSSEIDKWRGVKGRGRLGPKKNNGEPEALPLAWVAAAKKIYGEDVPLPSLIGELPLSVKSRIEAELKGAK